MKKRIEYCVAALVLGLIIIAMLAFWAATLFGLLWVCAAFPSFVAFTLFASLLYYSIKSLIE